MAGGGPAAGSERLRETAHRRSTCRRDRYGWAGDVERFHFTTTASGMLLDGQFLEFTRKSDILVAMSFDGVREAHDRHRRFPDGRGTFDVLLPRLGMLLATRPYSSVPMVVNPDTAESLCHSVAFPIEKSCRYVDEIRICMNDNIDAPAATAIPYRD